MGAWSDGWCLYGTCEGLDMGGVVCVLGLERVNIAFYSNLCLTLSTPTC